MNKRTVKIVLLVLAVVLIAVSAVMIVETMWNADEQQDAENGMGQNDFNIFVEDGWLYTRSNARYDLHAHVPSKDADTFMSSLAGLNVRVIDEAEQQQLIDSNWYSDGGYDEIYFVSVYDKNNNYILHLGIDRNSSTGEWCRAFSAGVYDQYFELMAAEDSNYNEVFDRLMKAAWGVNVSKYSSRFKKLDKKGKLSPETLREMTPTDYATYDEIWDELTYEEPENYNVLDFFDVAE